MAKRSTIVCGNTIFQKITQGKERIRGQKRKEKRKHTKFSVAEYNRRLSEKQLSILLNYNYHPGDMHLTLTYRRWTGGQQARKELKNFTDRLRRAYRKAGKTLKWVAVTEYKNHRVHHHVIVNQGLDLSEIINIWGKGKILCSVLDDSGDYRKLAAYLIKETDKTFRDPDAVQRQRYSCSRTVARPVIKEEEVSAAALLKDPKPIKGYYIDQDSIIRGRHPETENLYMEYVMVSLDAAPRLSIWQRGKKVPWFAGERWIREKEKQIKLEIKEDQPAGK